MSTVEDQIAVVGMACRVPGAPDVDTFWRNQLDGVDSIRRGPSADPNFVAAYGHLDGLTDFDAEFFGYSEEEAVLIDPQHRLFLEAAHSALVDAGHRADGRALVGVYTGIGANRYFLGHVLGRLADWEAAIPGSTPDYLPARVAYKLDLSGPAVAVQTACSSSLVAVCQAAQALLDYRCDLAVAGGAAVASTRQDGYRRTQGDSLSSDGFCRPFDATATGMVFGNGAGAVVLKRLPDAIADGDGVLAVLPGWAVNNDGAARAGFFAPNLAGQTRVVTEALAAAELDADTIGLVEAHGTGTLVGDAIEVAALTKAFGRNGSCALRSAKSAIGNLDAAAGVVGLIRAICSVRDGLIPPQLHFATLNPELDAGPFTIDSYTTKWADEPRRAGVSSFGLGGTNAHVIVEQAARDPGERPAAPRFNRRRHWLEPTEGARP
ncbi:polyketide synthase [Kutzneria sp. NPDC052558]|uniref:polyketide synthase n=1 Tax=Kutzneria sp. NPDC052558 TaxID=3364121 RepID=UPI0037C76F22